MSRKYPLSILNITVLTALTAPLLHADFAEAVLADEPLVFYRFEEDSGATTIADSSGNELHIDYSAPVGTTQLGVEGAVGHSVMFNGDGHIITPLVFDPSSGDFTIEAIINPNMVLGENGVIVANQNGSGVGRSNLLLSESGDVATFSGGTPRGTGVVTTNGTFYHVILTYDHSAAGSASDPTFRFYIDGVELGDGMMVAEHANGPWLLGSNKDLATQHFSGLVDELAIYDVRLDDPDGDGDTSDSRIEAHYLGYTMDSDILVSFESDTAYIDGGQSANLSWVVSPALTSLTLSDGTNPPIDVLADVVDNKGEISVSPTSTTTYTLEGTSPVGTESIQFTVVVDEPVVVDSFTSSVATVPAGTSIELAWAITNATSVEIDNGIGEVDPSGTATVVVNADTTYTLTATNSQGTVTATVTVELTDPNLIAHWSEAILADEPLVFYRFEEAPGATTITDSSGNELHIDYSAPVGTTELGVGGAVGLAAMFNGDGPIITPLVFDPSSGDFTIEAIINPSMVLGEIGVIVANQNGSGVGRSNLLVSETGQVAAFSGGGPTDSGFFTTNGTFYHIILTYDHSAAGSVSDPTFRFYIDGVERDGSMVVPEQADGPWILGSHKDLVIQHFTGLVDELAIYNVRLDDPDGDGDTSDSRIEAHYQGYTMDSDILVSFESDTAYIDGGQSANLSWVVSPALTSLTLSDGTNPPIDVLADVVDNKGEFTVSPTSTTTYTLEGTSPVGTETIQFTVVVDEPIVVDSFTSSVATVPAGTAIELAWAITNATSVEIDNGIGEVAPSGTATVIVNANTTYTLTATNSQGTVTATVTVELDSTDPSLVAHWQFDETGATFNGTLVGTPRFDTDDPAPVPGGSSASLVLDGAESWIDVLGYNGVGGAGERTISFWFKGPATQPNNNATLVSWGADTTGNRWDVRLNENSSGVLRTEVSGADSGSNGTAIVADGTWHHCAVVFDGTTIGDVRFYVDGVLDIISSAGTTPVDTTTDLNVRIGASRTIPFRSLTGQLDDIRIYDRALTEEEILTLIEPPLAEEFTITSVTILENKDVEIRWEAAPGDYSVEYSYDFDVWLELTSQSIPSGETSAVAIDTFDDPPTALVGAFAGITRIFYRIVRIE